MCIRDRLYLDEIQYFNKRQQQSLLECVEQGTVTPVSYTHLLHGLLAAAARLGGCRTEAQRGRLS